MWNDMLNLYYGDLTGRFAPPYIPQDEHDYVWLDGCIARPAPRGRRHA